VNPPVVLITGGAQRIGAEIARTLHATGTRIAIHYNRSHSAAESLVAELCLQREASAAAFQADFLDNSSPTDLIDAVIRHYGRLDGLINNASSFFATAVGTIDSAHWDDLVGSNLRTPLFLAQAAAPHLIASKGCIVNVTDIHAERPLKGYPVYCAAKAGLLGLTRSLAVELAPNVRVNAVAPGAILWPTGSDAPSADFPPDQQAAIIEHSLLKRLGSPSDIARTVRFLVLDAPYITGQVINVDGGRSAYL
jgi:pteridine reductase